MNHVFVSQQKIIQVQLLELFHDCSSDSHWSRNKILELIQHHFIWNEIMNDICIYVAMCLICQSKAIHCHKFYDQLEFLSVLKNTWNSSFNKINLAWVMKLLSLIKNSQEYNSILIIICYIIKYALFILIQNDCTITDFTKLFFWACWILFWLSEKHCDR